MTTLRKIAAEIHRILSGGQLSNDSELDERYTIELIRNAMAEILKLQYLTKRQVADDRTHEKMYVATYPKIEVKWDDDTERAYAELPDFYVSLPYNRGVVSVASMDKPLDPMIQKLNPSVSSTLPAGKLQGKIGYYVEGLRVYWDEDVRKKNVRKVLVKLIVPAPNTLKNDDNLPVTPEQVGGIIDRVIGWYKAEGIQDRISDSNKDIGVRISEQQ